MIINSNKLMTVQNLYNFHCVIEIFKIIKFATPISLNQLISLSQRTSSATIILPKPSHHFLYQSPIRWNVVSKSIIKFNYITMAEENLSMLMVGPGIGSIQT